MAKATGWVARQRGLWLVIAAFVALATAWNVVVPPYENLDELEHAEVVRHIAVTGRLPVHDVAEAAGFRVRQEASQPPLYHLLAAGWALLLRLPAIPHDPVAMPAAVVACGAADTLYNKATWIHDPALEGFPWHGATLTLHMLRGFSTLLQVATLAGVWTLSRRIFHDRVTPILATALVAFNPQLLLLAAGVNNDNAVIPLTTWGLVLAYDLWDRGPERWRPWAMGALSGFAALSKLSGLGLLGLGGLALLVRLAERRTTWGATLRAILALLLPAALLAAPWAWRNVRLYGDPTALAPMLAKVGYRKTAMGWGDARLMALSYWGQLPCSFYPRALYWPYLVLVGGGIAGTVVGWRQFNRRTRALLAMCGVWFAVIVVAWLRWNGMTPAPGGRLLFPAIAALAVPVAAGWRAAARWLVRLWGAFLPLWAAVALVSGPMAVFGLPMTLPSGAQVPHPADITFANDGEQAIALRGADVAIKTTPGACVWISGAYCGQTLDLTLYWEALEPLAPALTLVLQLVSPAPGATELRLNYNHWPGRGNVPTSTWPVGRVIRDRYLLPLPDYEGVTQAWDLRVALLDPGTGKRLPLEIAGNAAGNTALLATFRVEDEQPELPGWAHRATPVGFGTAAHEAAIVLRDARVTQDGTLWHVDLIWESRATVTDDLVTFVHAYAAGGTLLATGDGPPAEGAFPTYLWRVGDRVTSHHTLTLTEGTTGEDALMRIAVGLYKRADGTRLDAQCLDQVPDALGGEDGPCAGAVGADMSVTLWERP